MCYILTFTADPDSSTGYNCVATVDPEHTTTAINYIPTSSTGLTFSIHSPGFDTQTQYPNDRICIYDLPSCPGIQHISWSGNNFVLQDPGSFFFLPGVCTDTVELFGLSEESLSNGGATLQDPFNEKVLCGDQGDFTLSSSGQPAAVSINVVVLCTYSSTFRDCLPL